MIRALIAWTAVGSAAASASAMAEQGIFMDTLRTNLRKGRAGTGLDAGLDYTANVTWKALLAVATDSVSEQFYRGMSAPLSQGGYEYSLGNAAMTAFVTHFMENEGLEVQDADALQGFVMFYDGSCHKKAFKNLGEELRQMRADSRRIRCSGDWLKNRLHPSLLEATRQVGDKQFNAMLLKENIFTRAAAYKAGQEAAKGADTIGSVRQFVRDYIKELRGNVSNELKLEMFIGEFIGKESNAEDPLEKLTDALMTESEKPTGACVKLPRFDSRSVTLVEEKPLPTKLEAEHLFAHGLKTNGSEGLYVSKGDHYEGGEHMIYKDPKTGMWKIVGKSKKAQVLGAGPYEGNAWTTCNVQIEGSCGGFSELIQTDAGKWESQESLGTVGRVGTTAPLDERGYQAVLGTGVLAEMVDFVNRTATSLSLTINKRQIVAPFSKWYNGDCADQSFAALQSELKSMPERPAACGGGWVSASPSLSQWRSVFKHRRAPLRR